MTSTSPVKRPIGQWAVQYAVAVVVLCVVDLVWLTTVAVGLYDDLLGDLERETPIAWAAALFYALYVAAVLHFVVHPALEARSARRALLGGAFLGLTCYATWDLTNLAVIDGFPAALVPIDLAWGASLTAVVSLATYAAARRLGHAPAD